MNTVAQNISEKIQNKPTADKPMTAEEKIELAEEIAGEPYEEIYTPDLEYSENNGMNIDESTGKDEYKTEPVPEGKPVPVEPQDAVIENKELTCTLSVRCDTICRGLIKKSGNWCRRTELYLKNRQLNFMTAKVYSTYCNAK